MRHGLDQPGDRVVFGDARVLAGPTATAAGPTPTSSRRPTATRSSPAAAAGWNCAGCGIDSSFSYAVSSNHPGGANILMTDGSVRFVKDSVARLTWWALGTRNGGEVISSDSY